MDTARLVSFTIRVKESILSIQAKRNLHREATKILLGKREIIERYIYRSPFFKTTLKPVNQDQHAPLIIRKMIEAGQIMGVGPMASIAGAIAQEVGLSLAVYSDELIVENGGDIFLKSHTRRCIAIHAASSPFSEKLALEIKPTPQGISICTSSGTAGHSFSFGKADAAVAISESAYLADAAATAIGNVIQTEEDIMEGIKIAQSTPGIVGAVIIKGEKLSVWGKVTLIPI
ncbi:MAG: UPF0280 family protein [bacterium]